MQSKPYSTTSLRFSKLIALMLLGVLLFLSACTTKLAEPTIAPVITSTLVEMKSAGLELLEAPGPLPELQFGLFSQGKGWLAVDRRTFLTADNGEGWDEISVQVPENYSLARIHFLNENEVWAYYLGGEGASPRTLFYSSGDGGKTWHDLSEGVNAQLQDADLLLDGRVYINRLNADQGWLLLKQATGVNFSSGILLKTEDGGLSWNKLTAPAGEDFIFADQNNAFMLKGPQMDSLYASSDAGLSWAELKDLPATDGADTYRVSMPIFQSDGYGVFPLFAYQGDMLLKTSIMQTRDYGKTWSLGAEDPDQIEQSPGSEPYFQLLPDGNLSRWSRIPRGGKAIDSVSSEGQRVQITKLAAFGTEHAWGTFRGGLCEAQAALGKAQLACGQDQVLGFTADGGKNWQPLLLPLNVTKSSKSLYAPAVEPKGPEGVGGMDGIQMKAINPTVKVAVGHGFDQCEIPSNAALDAWSDASPYTVVNLYIGGSARACSNRALTYNKVAYLYNNGWTFIPTWVGPQAPCTDYRSRMSMDPATAYQEGVENANQAMAKMFELGLTDAAGRGGVVYYDLEYYVGNSSCQTAVKSFFEGWNSRMHQHNALSGVYGASCHYWSQNQPPQNLSNLADLKNPVDAIWVAKYINTPYYYNPTVSVWGIASCLPDSLWSQNQRLRQYTGGHYETWGGYSINIDSNVLLGPVAYPAIGDTLAPQTSLSFSGTPGENGYYKSTGNVTLTAVDRQAGVEATYYRLDDGAETKYSVPIALTQNRDYKITYYSIDQKGNREPAKTAVLSIDSLPPVSSASLDGTTKSGWYVSPVSLKVSAQDNFSGVNGYQYQLNDSAWVDIALGQSATISQNGGGMTLKVRSKDKAGNYSAVQSYSISIDTSAPQNPLYADPHCDAISGVTQGVCNDPDFTWHGASDAGSGLAAYEYYWGQDPNGQTATGKNAANDNHFDPAPVADGSVTYLRIRSQDNLGTWSAWKTLFILRYTSGFVNFNYLPVIAQGSPFN